MIDNVLVEYHGDKNRIVGKRWNRRIENRIVGNVESSNRQGNVGIVKGGDDGMIMIRSR